MAAVNDRLKEEVIEAQSELETKLAEVQAKAKAQRQNAHIADRERRQDALKEMVSDRCSTSHRCTSAALSVLRLRQ